ncbi:DNA-binding protein WhiA [Peptoniphilus raoultii]|uniref:DNA-binding protein WhiA n=1 Tax=Peptoniphilus raoultii TaxID=1776387 RepID=UPI0008DB2466|nr:DNA-binding protein WhiA [Peptoniphilus raoultii]
MSFSASVKNELSKYKLEGFENVIAELSGLVPMCGLLSYKNGKVFLKINSESASVTRRVFTFLRRFFGFDLSIKNTRSKQLKNNLYTISLDEESSRVLLDEIDFIKGENVFIPNYVPSFLKNNAAAKKAYIRGAFLGASTIVDPKKSYHLEFITNNLDHANFLQKTILEFSISAKIAPRRESFIVYLKDSQAISDLLSLMGAHKSVLAFEDTRVLKDMRNRVNRIVNCETYNLNKIVASSINQVKDIEYIRDKIGLEKLPKELRDLAEIRLEDREISLADIGRLVDPPVSKSTVNYRFKKIENISNKLRGGIDDR